MKFSLSAAATAAALASTTAALPFGFSPKPYIASEGKRSATPRQTFANMHSTPPAHLLVANPGHIYVTQYVDSGNGFNSSCHLTTENDFPVSGDPSWLAFVEPDLIYAVDEASSTTRLFQLSQGGSSNGTNSTYGGGGGGGSLTLKTIAEKQASAGVVHLEFNREGTRMLGSAYAAGSVDVWNTEGHGLELMKTIKSTGPLGPGQDGAHPHQARMDPSGRYFVVNDLGTDRLLLIDGKDDAWDVIKEVPVEPAGSGPRHGAFFPPDADKATHYMVLCELSNQIVVWALDYKHDTIDFRHVQTISSFDPSNPPATPQEAAAGGLVLQGHDVYVSNRLTGDATDNIAHFKIDPSHEDAAAFRLSFRGQVSSGGVLPRMFSLTRDKGTLLVGNQRGGDGVAALARRHDGSLEQAPLAVIPGSTYGPQGTTLGPKYVEQF